MIAEIMLSLLILLSLTLGSVKLISLGHSDSKFMKRSAIEITKILRQEKSFFCSTQKNTTIKVTCHEPNKKIQLQFNSY